MAKLLFSTSSRYLIEYDTETLVSSIVGQANVVFTDIAVSEDGSLYGIDFTSIYEIDVFGNSITTKKLFDLGAPSMFNALEFDTSGNTLYAASQDDIYRVDLQSKTTDFIGTTHGYFSSGDLLINGGTMVMSTTSNELITFDLASSATDVLSDGLPPSMFGLAADATRLYGFADSTIYRINVDTDQAVPVASFENVGQIWGATSGGMFDRPASNRLELIEDIPGSGVTASGKVALSMDGLGTTSTGNLQAQIPAGSQIVAAYLHVATRTGGYPPALAPAAFRPDEISFGGQVVELDYLANVDDTTHENFETGRADVTDIVRAAYNGVTTNYSFFVDERTTGNASLVEGTALSVVYSNPTLPEASVFLLEGGVSSSTPRVSSIIFTDFLDPSAPGFFAKLGVGIQFGYDDGGQYTEIDVNGVRLTSSAGDSDDAVGASQNGTLITVGGVGDSTGNPSNPASTSLPLDDELYDLKPLIDPELPFLSISSRNPSDDDLLFLAGFQISAEGQLSTPVHPFNDFDDNVFSQNDAGSQSFDGGPGFDILRTHTSSASVSIESVDMTTKIMRSDAFGIDTLIAVERLHLDDGFFAFDVEGNAGKAYRLYQAAYDRMPDTPGVSFWTAVLDYGLSLNYVADEFVAADEFKQLYGSNPTNEQYIDLLYDNVLDRDADTGGYAYWVDRMYDGVSWGQMLIEFSESLENKAKVANQIDDGIWLNYITF